MGIKKLVTLALLASSFILHAMEVQKFVFPLPVEYRCAISSKQGLRSLDITESKFHNALDISCPEGTKVFASKNGVVTNVYPSYYNGGALYKGHPTYGGLVEITHYDHTKTLYAHLSMTLVREGESVSAGQLIGKSGGVKGKRGSGTSTGAHLHFEIVLDIETFLE